MHFGYSGDLNCEMSSICIHVSDLLHGLNGKMSSLDAEQGFSGFCAGPCYLHTPSVQSSAMAQEPTLSPVQWIMEPPKICILHVWHRWGQRWHRAGLPVDPTHTLLWGVCNRRFVHCPQLVGKSCKVVDCLSWDCSALPHFSSLSPA